MTPPNELEQLADFQDAIQSEEGLERLRAMQYLQQMNNQGIMGLPQVRQQPVVRRQNSGPISLDSTILGPGTVTFNTLEEGTANTEVGETFMYNGKIYVVDVSVDTEGNQIKIPALRSSDQIDMFDSDRTSGLDKITQEQIDAGHFTLEEAYRHNNYLRDLEQSNQDRSQYDIRKIAEQGGLDWRGVSPDNSMWNVQEENKYGGPVVKRFGGGLLNLTTPADDLAAEVNYQEDSMSSPQAMNDEIVNTQGEGITFNFGAARFISNTGGPIPLRENTAQGIFDRATQGGVVDTRNMFRGYGPRHQGGLGGKIIDTWGSNEPPQPVNLPIQSQDVIMPTNMVEYTPPFIGGGMVPQPTMVPADEQGNPIMPISKQALGFGAPMTAEQGGYVLDLAGGGLAQGRELQQLREGGLVDLPVVKMGFGGWISNVFSSITKPIRKVVKSKTFKALAPLVLAVAAPYALGALAPSVFGASASALGGALSTSGALGYGLATGLGSMAGNLLSGAKFGDAAKQALISGATAGAFKGFGSGNWMGPGTGGTGAAGTMGQKGYSKTGSALMDQSKNLPGYGPASNIGDASSATKAGTTQVFDYGSAPAAKPTKLVYEPVPQGTTVFNDAPGGMKSFTPDPTIVEPKTITPITNTFQAPTPKVDPSTWSQIKQAGTQIGKDIWKDYSNWQGAAKLVGMDMMQPDWDQVYASESAMEDQLRKMGYDIVDTGYGTQRVIRDPSGVTLPSNLSVQDILDRALGRTPRTRLADKLGFEPNASQFAAQGGLVSLAGGGEFSGMVEGDGHGMQDNVYMPIKERGHGKQIGTLAVSPSEYVVDAHTMSALGNGNPDAGAKVMDTVIESVRKKAYGTVRQPNEINGLDALMPMMERV